MNFLKYFGICSTSLALLLAAPLSALSLENITFSRLIDSPQLENAIAVTPDEKGHLLVLRKGDNVVSVLDQNGNPVSSFGDEKESRRKTGLRQPSDIEIDSEGNIYVSDTGNNRIAIYDKDYNFTREIGKSRSSRNNLQSPMGIKIDKDGNVYVADSGNDRIQVFNSQGMSIMTFQGNETSSRDIYYIPDILSMTQVSDNPYDARQKRKSDTGGKGSQETKLSKPTDVAIDGNGNIYVADTGNGRVIVFARNGTISHSIGVTGSDQKEFRKPTSLLIDSLGRLFISDSGNNKIGILNITARSYQELGTRGRLRGGEFNSPASLSLDKAGNLYIADSQNNRVQVFSVGNPAVAETGKGKKEIVLKESVPVAVLSFKGVGSPGLLSAEVLTELVKDTLEGADHIQFIDSKELANLEPDENGFRKLKAAGASFAVYGQVSENGAYTEVYLKIFHTPTGKNELQPRIIKIANNDYREFSEEVVKQVKEVYAAHYLPPEPPTGFMASGGDKKVTLSWKKPVGVEIDHVNVYRSNYSDSRFEKIAESRGEGYTDAGLGYGGVRYYRLTLVNLEGVESEPSTVASAATFAAPNSLQKLNAVPLAKAVKLHWEKAPDVDKSGFQNVGYRVYRAPADNDDFKEIAFISFDSKGALNEYIDEQLAEDSWYRYKVALVNEKKVESLENEIVSVKTIGYPKNFSATSGEAEKVTLAWEVEESPEVEGYQIYVSEDGRNFDKLTRIPSRKTTEYVDGEGWVSKKKQSGMTYHYRITTLASRDYETVESPVVSAKTKNLPLPPTGLKSQLMKDEEKKTMLVRISWEKSPTKDVVKYQIHRRGGSEKNFSKRDEVGNMASFFDDERVKEGESFEYSVKSVDADGLVSDSCAPVTVDVGTR